MNKNFGVDLRKKQKEVSGPLSQLSPILRKYVLLFVFFVTALLATQPRSLEVNCTTYALNKSYSLKVADSGLSDMLTSTDIILSVMTPSISTVFDYVIIALVTDLTESFENMSLVTADDISKFKGYIDSTAENLIVEMIKDGIQPQDNSAIKKLQIHLEGITQLSDKDSAFFKDLTVFINPVARARNLTNVEDIWVKGNVLTIDNLTEKIPRNSNILTALASEVDEDPLLFGGVVSNDHAATNIHIKLTV